MTKDEEIKKLKSELASKDEQLKSYIPRRRVRRVYKQLKHILEQDLIEENNGYINYLKVVIRRFRGDKDTPGNKEFMIDEPTIVAIEHLLGYFENSKGW